MVNAVEGDGRGEDLRVLWNWRLHAMRRNVESENYDNQPTWRARPHPESQSPNETGQIVKSGRTNKAHQTPRCLALKCCLSAWRRSLYLQFCLLAAGEGRTSAERIQAVSKFTFSKIHTTEK
jgi:hypothetical protein